MQTEQDRMIVNMGPQHPSTHGVFRVVLNLDGERAVDLDCRIGYLHRGIEKLAERRTYGQITPLVDRIDYTAAFLNEFAYVQAVEALAGIPVPERAEYIRVILAEFQRIISHIVFYSFAGLEAGAVSPMFFAFADREKILDLFEMVTGARLTYNFMRIGGVKDDLPRGFAKKAQTTLNYLERKIDELQTLLSGNEIFIKRLKDVGIFKAKDAIDLGATGPTLRGSGVKYDLRKIAPYSVYDQFEFNIPIGKTGDSLDRYRVRMEEIYQSMKIIRQALDGLPEGEVRTDVPEIVRPEGEVYGRAEGAAGEVGFYLVGNGTEYPERVKIRGPSFANIFTFGQLTKGSLIADLVMIFGSISVCMGECDR